MLKGFSEILTGLVPFVASGFRRTDEGLFSTAPDRGCHPAVAPG